MSTNNISFFFEKSEKYIPDTHSYFFLFGFYGPFKNFSLCDRATECRIFFYLGFKALSRIFHY